MPAAIFFLPGSSFWNCYSSPYWRGIFFLAQGLVLQLLLFPAPANPLIFFLLAAWGLLRNCYFFRNHGNFPRAWRALWKDMLLHLSNGHIFLWFRGKRRRVDGGDWGVHLWMICRTKNFFFSGQGTCVPLETSATHRSKE